MALHSLSQGQGSAALYDPFMPSKPVPLGNSSILPSPATAQGTTLAISETRLLCDLRKHFSEDLTSMMLLSS